MMKTHIINRKGKIFIVIVVSLILINIFIGFLTSINFHRQEYNVKSSQKLEIGPIYIDDSDPNFNWTKFASEHVWCTGNGTFLNPYKINNIQITSVTSSNCIEIKNSNVFFKISNCYLTNGGGGAGSKAGIKLVNISNGIIFLNDISHNRANGIFLLNSNNNSIIQNVIIDNIVLEIYLENSDYNLILENNIVSDIMLRGSNFNNFSNNQISHSEYFQSGTGIEILDSSHDNILIGNIFTKCGIVFPQLSLNELKSYLIDTTNSINGKPVYFYVDEKDLEPSNFTDAGQVILVNCSESNISNINPSQGVMGISLFYSRNNSITDCSVTENKRYGIFLCSSDNNKITANALLYNFIGIAMTSCANNIINDNLINYNTNAGMFNGGIGSPDNLVYINYFSMNDVNVVDNGYNIKWDNDIFGNYWDDYAGVDANQDGIGDTPHSFDNIFDQYPLYREGPTIILISPKNNEEFVDPPFIELVVQDPNLDRVLYTLNGSMYSIMKYELNGNGFVDHIYWSMLGYGNVYLKIYAIDIYGIVNSIEIMIIKTDFLPPPPLSPQLSNFEIFIIISVLALLISFVVLIGYNYVNKGNLLDDLKRIRPIKKGILELGVNFEQLKITEIAKKLEAKSSHVKFALKDMIKKNEITASYSIYSRSVRFDQESIIEEVDLLIEKFERWDKQDKSKKK